MTSFAFFFFTALPTTEIYTLSLHDALPICGKLCSRNENRHLERQRYSRANTVDVDRKSTRLNSSHLGISYAVFCLKKKTGSRNEHPAIADIETTATGSTRNRTVKGTTLRSA